MNEGLHNGARVEVSPVDRPDQISKGTIILISENKRSAAIGFTEKPPSMNPRSGVFISYEGIIMLVFKEQPEGPYVDLMDGRGYEVRPL